MGTIGTGVFENDDALDFLIDVEDAGDRWGLIRHTLREVVEQDDHLEAPTASAGLAAVALVASAAQPDLLDGVPYAPMWWVEHPPETLPGDLPELARAAVRRATGTGEWRESWEEAGSLEKALAEVLHYARAL